VENQPGWLAPDGFLMIRLHHSFGFSSWKRAVEAQAADEMMGKSGFGFLRNTLPEPRAEPARTGGVSMASQNRRHRPGANHMAKALQFTADPDLAPLVLFGHPEDQGLDLLAGAWPAHRLGDHLPGLQQAVPPPDGLRLGHRGDAMKCRPANRRSCLGEPSSPLGVEPPPARRCLVAVVVDLSPQIGDLGQQFQVLAGEQGRQQQPNGEWDFPHGVLLPLDAGANKKAQTPAGGANGLRTLQQLQQMRLILTRSDKV
jgi:hypothetical protein